MPKTLEMLFDFTSPNVWLAYRALPPILARTQARLQIEPALLGGVFRLTGNQPPKLAFGGVKGKWEYEMLEFRRFLARYGLFKFRMNPKFPVNSVLMMRGLLAARGLGVEPAYIEAVLQGVWEEGLDLAEAGALSARLAQAGLDGAGIVAAAQTPEIKAELAARTDQAVARGVFGMPTFFVGAEMFFGKERLAQVEEALAAS